MLGWEVKISHVHVDVTHAHLENLSLILKQVFKSGSMFFKERLKLKESLVKKPLIAKKSWNLVG